MKLTEILNYVDIFIHLHLPPDTTAFWSHVSVTSVSKCYWGDILLDLLTLKAFESCEASGNIWLITPASITSGYTIMISQILFIRQLSFIIYLNIQAEVKILIVLVLEIRMLLLRLYCISFWLYNCTILAAEAQTKPLASITKKD